MKNEENGQLSLCQQSTSAHDNLCKTAILHTKRFGSSSHFHSAYWVVAMSRKFLKSCDFISDYFFSLEKVKAFLCFEFFQGSPTFLPYVTIL